MKFKPMMFENFYDNSTKFEDNNGRILKANLSWSPTRNFAS